MSGDAIPAGWQLVELARLGVFLKGSGIRKDEAQSGEIPAVRYGELYTDHQEILRVHRSFISQAVSKTARPIRQGDILFAGSGETKEEIGKCTGFIGDYEAFAGGDIIIFRPSGADARFLAYLLNSAPIAQQKAQRAQGDAVVHIYPDALGKLRLPLPPLPEQQAIAAALSDADGVVAGLERVIAKKRLIKQGAMQDLLTARRRLPGFLGAWEVKRLGSVLKMQVGFPFSSAFFSTREIGPRLVRNRDLRSNDDLVFYSGAFADQFLLYDGDILIGMDGDFSPTIWSGGTALLNQRVGRLKALAKIDLRFCYYVLQDELKKIESVTSGTTVKHLSHYDIEKIAVRMPGVDEQQAIAAVLSDMDAEIQTLEARLAKARAVKEGMMQNLLTGRVRLV